MLSRKWLAALVVMGLAGCGAPAATEKPVTVIVKQTVAVPQTVVVPQTVIVRETVVAPQTLVVKAAAPTAPAATVAPLPAPVALALSGRGQQATAKFTLPAGLVVFEMKHDGKSNFIVHLLNDQGQQVTGSLVNAIGTFDGSKAVQIPKMGTYLLDIAADGNWSI